jgi:hypothetical protein
MTKIAKAAKAAKTTEVEALHTVQGSIRQALREGLTYKTAKGAARAATAFLGKGAVEGADFELNAHKQDDGSTRWTWHVGDRAKAIAAAVNAEVAADPTLAESLKIASVEMAAVLKADYEQVESAKAVEAAANLKAAADTKKAMLRALKKAKPEVDATPEEAAVERKLEGDVPTFLKRGTVENVTTMEAGRKVLAERKARREKEVPAPATDTRSTEPKNTVINEKFGKPLKGKPAKAPKVAVVKAPKAPKAPKKGLGVKNSRAAKLSKNGKLCYQMIARDGGALHSEILRATGWPGVTLTPAKAWTGVGRALASTPEGDDTRYTFTD